MYFLFFIAFVITQSTLSPWLQTVFGFGSFQTGLIFFYVGGVSVFTQAALLPLLSKRLSRLSIVGLGLASLIVSMFVLAVSINFSVLIAVIPLFSFGFGIQFVTLNTFISTNTPEEAQGGALGVAWAIAGAAQSIAPVIGTSVFDFGNTSGFVGLAFLVSALVSLIILPLVYAFKKQHGHSR
jgi:MFS family permease